MKTDTSVEDLISKGNKLFDSGKYNEAIERYDKALGIDPNNTNAICNKGLCFAKLELYEVAIKYYDKVLKVDPDNIDALSYKGLALAGSGKHKEAIEFWTYRGLALQSEEKYEDAIKAYDKAIEIDPRDAYSWSNKGGALVNQGKYEDAIKSLDKAIEIDPRLAPAWNNRGIALTKQGKYEDAIKSLDKAIEIDPQGAYLWYSRGLALQSEEKYEDAIKAYDKAIEIDPKYSDALNKRREAIDKLGMFPGIVITAWKGPIIGDPNEHNEAIQSFDKSLGIDPHNSTIWSKKGLALLRLGKYSDAIECLDRALEICPEDVEAWVGKGYALFIAALLRARNPVIIDSAGAVESIKCYDKAIEIDPNYTSAWCSKGDALSEMEKYEEAKKCYDKAKELGCNHDKEYATYVVVEQSDGSRSVYIKDFEDGSSSLDSTRPMSDRPGHLWTGLNYPAPPETVQASDTIQLLSDSGIKTIPDKSWVIDLFEIYNTDGGGGVINLGLVSEYTGKTRYVAILQCSNKYYFNTPVVKGHVYRRTVSIDKSVGLIYYVLEDTTSKTQERFQIDIPLDFLSVIVNVYRGVEWHNLIADEVFPVAWDVSLSTIVSFSCNPSPLPTTTTMPTNQPTSDELVHLTNETFDKGNALSNSGRYDEAIECYDKTLEIDPEYDDAWYNKGLALHALGKYEEAIECYDKVHVIDDVADAWAWCNRGKV